MAGLARKVQEEIERAPSLATLRVKRTIPGKEVPVEDVPCMPAMNGERMGLDDGDAGGGAADDVTNATTEDQGVGDGMVTAPQPVMSVDAGLFDGMDDVFGTYMDPNYPVNLDDLSFLDDMQPFDWNNAGYAGGATW